MIPDQLKQDIDQLEDAIQASKEAYEMYKAKTIKERVALMRAIARAIEDLDETVIKTAMEETHLSEGRLTGEKARTVNQWRSYADDLESGEVLDIRIDTALPDRNPPRVDIRKTMVPLGPVAVFGASNFPFAFSTAGNDTASAMAAGNAVIVKAHPAHPKTAEIMGKAISTGIEKAGYPRGLFRQVFGEVELGTALVEHPAVQAVGFTGSFGAGKALFDAANKRDIPIPVFAEMGSINPMFLLPERLKNSDESLAGKYVGSLTLGSGQFCTNPGTLAVIKGEGYDQFKEDAKTALTQKPAERMLHEGIATGYANNAQAMTDFKEVSVLARGKEGQAHDGQAVLAETTAKDFLHHKKLCGEVFGPFGLIIVCDNKEEMKAVAQGLEGQLTISLLAEPGELSDYNDLILALREKCGRLLFNNFPTGVEVCIAMQHGGPFPATTNSQTTSVGSDAVKRFQRPVSYQNWPKDLLPEELKDENPLNLIRTINGKSGTWQIERP